MSRYEEVAVVDREGWRVLVLAGEVDVATAPRLRDRLVQLVTDGSAHLVIDLTGVTFLDSMGLGALVSGLKRARAQDGDLRLAGPSDHVAHVLSITRLDRAFVVATSVDAAVGESRE